MPDVDERIAALERANRNLKFSLAVFAAISVWFVWKPGPPESPAQPSKVVSEQAVQNLADVAKRIDNEPPQAGKVEFLEVETLFVTKRLLVGDLKRANVVLTADGTTATAILRDTNGKGRIVLHSGDDKSASILIRDGDERPKVFIDQNNGKILDAQ